MKYTIIVSIYNQETLLPQIFKAWAGQSYQDFEVIFADDGSDDGTQNHFANLKSLPFPYWYVRNKTSKKMRLAKTINRAIKIARGKYCVFVMGDSFPDRQFLEIMDQYADINLVLCGVRAHIENGMAVDADWRLKKGLIPEHACMIPERPFEALTGNGLIVPTWAFKKYGGWSAKFSGYGGDDNEIIARLYYNGLICWSIPQAVVYHNWHKEKVESPKKYKMLSKLYNKYYGKTPDTSWKKILYGCSRLWFSLTRLGRFKSS